MASVRTVPHSLSTSIALLASVSLTVIVLAWSTPNSAGVPLRGGATAQRPVPAVRADAVSIRSSDLRLQASSGRVVRSLSGAWAPTPDVAALRYQAPIIGPLVVVRPFEPPPTRYAAGHRGVDLREPANGLVVAAATSRVLFAGPVAGRQLVVLMHGDGVKTEYEPITPLVRVGQTVSGGEVIGRVDGSHGGFPADSTLHWGARRNGDYFDPLLLLRPLGPVRLLPWR